MGACSAKCLVILRSVKIPVLRDACQGRDQDRQHEHVPYW